jgi:hypothetical protein
MAITSHIPATVKATVSSVGCEACASGRMSEAGGYGNCWNVSITNRPTA